MLARTTVLALSLICACALLGVVVLQTWGCARLDHARAWWSRQREGRRG
jgi:hypothetical protein